MIFVGSGQNHSEMFLCRCCAFAVPGRLQNAAFVCSIQSRWSGSNRIPAIARPRFVAKTLYQSTPWVCISSAFLAGSDIAMDFVVPTFARSDTRHWS
ncbi:hypothetical protein PHSY_001420 [Pseudozyma hubeiensis SY62]|uniref:Uncharacterized protein n=1 Tax=Pseudozyma hubeiensis (strain SY62) TaxID=1305764 RepID=R9NYR5_PSEHS|nr:hypothetical protein PHSY_001420 [Pseudozyma hubeiensis SY62]GAC93854.1 hypothetical protein PHSY_001420 [Pseudozyma hubeiensis SY62]